jgi:hypothetical protein
LSTVKLLLWHWHERLGHPSMVIVQRVLDDSKIAFSHEASSPTVCDACQCAKSHQLSFPKSSSVSKVPLELVFSDMWGGGGHLLVQLAKINITLVLLMTIPNLHGSIS